MGNLSPIGPEVAALTHPMQERKPASVSAELMEKALLGGDLAKLTSAERLSYYNSVCQSLGLNPLTRPFEYITLNNKLTLYARKDATEQLRKIHNLSIKILSRELVEGVYVVTAQASEAIAGGHFVRTDEAIGAVALNGLQGEAKANGMMKAESKAKRRVTLSIAGLGAYLDETEIESVPSAKIVPMADVEHSTPASAQGSISVQLESLHASVADTAAADPVPAFLWRVGKHKGESIRTIDSSYLDWFAREGKLEDHRNEARMELDRRQAQETMTMDVMGEEPA
jgi:hypothetical protein